MMRPYVLFISLLSLFLCLAPPATAQDAVKVRTGSHDAYSRLVFEWPGKPQYSISKEGGRILVRFGKAGTPDMAGVSSSARNISKVETISQAGEPLQMGVTIPDGSRFRDFMVENKLIIDVYNSSDTPAPQAKVEALKEQAPKPAPEPAQQATPKEKQDFSIKPAESGNAVPLTQVEAAKVPAPDIGAHVISLTATSGFGLTAYERSGFLWLVIDNTEAGLAPQLAGPQKNSFPPFKQVSLPDGVIYSLELPEGVHAEAKGGGLGWQVMLSSKVPAVKSATPKRSEDDGKLVWPLADMRKVITFTDPVVGDKVVAVTASQAEQAAGSPRQYVDLATLPSVAGLALVPKVDDLKTEITLKTVVMGRPQGLSLAREKDSQPAAIREATQQAPEPVKPEETVQEPEKEGGEAKAGADAEEGADGSEIKTAISEKPPTNNIYNFQRWQMGGVRELNNNQHVMMLDGAGKKDNELAETMIALAKLNLANDRAPEALGLLRIAMQSVPELKDNPEFIALRAAAFALSSKYDEAMTDYTDEKLKPYIDVKYWNAYTLAGLEDWSQAFEKMPTSFQMIETYPIEIRAKLMLTFAEIALRGAKVQMAKDILGKIEPHLKELPLPYNAAWNYLMGEAERQAGNSAKAETYWDPLVKNGKDDLYRAKAGLSLTKLQLDEKKIKPADAIYRLEGLRYAWRGDELETLVNYRLGQMYLEDKDYLKGFTVLRNADSLSPETDLGRTVNDYMNKKFREVFAGNALKEMTPLDAISLYEEFKDLIPPGEEGDNFADKLAERLVDADLLGRASSLLEYQVNHRLKGDKKAEVAIRLAAIRLLDGNPDGALRSLEIAQDVLNKIEPAAGPAVAVPDEEVQPANAKPEEAKAEVAPAAPLSSDSEKQRQINLLKARALSMKKKTDEAMAILEGMRLDPDVNRLRADITWSAGRWEDAAVALNDLLVGEDISSKRPLTQYQADLILNRGIALNLSNNRVALANLRDRYNAQMKVTDKGQVFEIVTRPRRPDMIGSRESIEKMISEIDFFKGFLEGYGKLTGEKKDAAPAAPAADAAKPETKEPAETPAAEPETKS